MTHLLPLAALYASAVAAAAVTFRSWDVRSGAEVEHWDVYVAPALVFWATWPVGWRWYGRRVGRGTNVE